MADSPEQSLPKIKLYWLNQSRSQRIVWLLEELQVPYEIEVFHRTKEMLAPPELAKIHPLGKSPVISITPPQGGEPVVLAESGFMTQYLCEHLPGGKRLIPPRWKAGQEDQVGGETEAYLRYQYYLHYCEGSLMPLLVMTIIISQRGGNDDDNIGLQSPNVPFFIRPITSAAAGRIFSAYIYPNLRRHLAMLEDQLATSPDGGVYLCGRDLTAADILMSFPLIASKGRLRQVGPWEGGCWTDEFPRLGAYTAMLEKHEGYVGSVRKIEEVDGEFTPTL
ncbi:glutathione S-transferase [Geosmithia morbida]|uniref:Glutathione S-transferase n=1 Tax=Geosmithia morbida TaxID=1094350 RepID=A0A9P4YR55_9HYPO|nr:glutathione S-transferase [Geosmithia morbida]KAF4120307.1 glutathione S-transferase [Geosmithia morbida]